MEEKKGTFYRIPEDHVRQALAILNAITIKGTDADKIVMLKSIFAGAEKEEG